MNRRGFLASVGAVFGSAAIPMAVWPKNIEQELLAGKDVVALLKGNLNGREVIYPLTGVAKEIVNPIHDHLDMFSFDVNPFTFPETGIMRDMKIKPILGSEVDIEFEPLPAYITAHTVETSSFSFVLEQEP